MDAKTTFIAYSLLLAGILFGYEAQGQEARKCPPYSPPKVSDCCAECKQKEAKEKEYTGIRESVNTETLHLQYSPELKKRIRTSKNPDSQFESWYNRGDNTGWHGLKQKEVENLFSDETLKGMFDKGHSNVYRIPRTNVVAEKKDSTNTLKTLISRTNPSP